MLTKTSIILKSKIFENYIDKACNIDKNVANFLCRVFDTISIIKFRLVCVTRKNIIYFWYRSSAFVSVCTILSDSLILLLEISGLLIKWLFDNLLRLIYFVIGSILNSQFTFRQKNAFPSMENISSNISLEILLFSRESSFDLFC